LDYCCVLLFLFCYLKLCVVMMYCFLNDVFKHFVDIELLQNIVHLEFGVLDGCMLIGHQVKLLSV
jgi:hypothetical protein